MFYTFQHSFCLFYTCGKIALRRFEKYTWDSSRILYRKEYSDVRQRKWSEMEKKKKLLWLGILIIFAYYQILLELLGLWWWTGRYVYLACGRLGNNTKFSGKAICKETNLREQFIVVYRVITLELFSEKYGLRTRSGLSWLRRWSTCRLLWTRWWTEVLNTPSEFSDQKMEYPLFV
jgi:hypothetical protein